MGGAVGETPEDGVDRLGYTRRKDLDATGRSPCGPFLETATLVAGAISCAPARYMAMAIVGGSAA